MSNTAINIRVLLWHWQVTFCGESTFEINKFRQRKGKLKSFLFPIAIYDFKPWMIK